MLVSMGDPVCYMHLLDEDGRMPEVIEPEAEPGGRPERDGQERDGGADPARAPEPRAREVGQPGR
jgi:hypothetical protein